MTVTARYFLVERYLPEVDVGSLVAAIQRQTASTRHIGTVVIVAEETCLSVFEAADARSVAAATEAVGVPADRIVEAEWFPGPST